MPPRAPAWGSRGETTAAFVTALSAQSRLEILKAQAGAIARWVPLLQTRLDAGASSPSEISRAKVAANLAKVALARAKSALLTARRE